jgi:hypothetical protein
MLRSWWPRPGQCPPGSGPGDRTKARQAAPGDQQVVHSGHSGGAGGGSGPPEGGRGRGGTGSEGRISNRWNRSLVDGRDRTSTWCDYDVLAHDLVEVANLTTQNG